MKSTLFWTSIVIGLSGAFAPALAQTMDLKTHNLLILKLEKGQDKKSKLSNDIETRAIERSH